MKRIVALLLASIPLFGNSLPLDQSFLFADIRLDSVVPSVNSFGRAVAIDGDWLMVGASAHGLLGRNIGVVQVFRKFPGDEWIFTELLTDPEGHGNFNDFGAAIALEGGKALIGNPAFIDPTTGGFTGAAYEFDLGTDGKWKPAGKISDPLPSVPSKGSLDGGNSFGRMIALDGGRALIGAPDADRDDGGTGKVYSFRSRSDGSWVPEGSVVLPEGFALGSSGTSVALRGDDGVVAAVNRRAGDDARGAALAYHFAAGRWSGGTSLVPGGRGFSAPNVAMDSEGAALAFGDGIVVFRIGADGEWKERAELPAFTTPVGDWFGCSIALEGSLVLVGARNAERGRYDAVCVYDLERPRGREAAAEIMPFDQKPSSYPSFGDTVVLKDGTAVIGATFASVGGKQVGAVYIVRVR